MSKSFVFIGEPDADAPAMLETIVASKLVPKRFSENADIEDISLSNPAAIIIEKKVKNREQCILKLRENPKWDNVPILAKVANADKILIESAFSDGADYFLSCEQCLQFKAFIAIITKVDSWEIIRAPAGLIVIAHENSIIRMRFAQILRRRGFDFYFASNSSELEHAIETVKSRVIIASSKLVNKSTLTMVDKKESPPWLVLAQQYERGRLKRTISKLDNADTIKKFKLHFWNEQADAESCIFLINSLLAPPCTDRRTTRILFGVPVTYQSSFIEAPNEQVFLGYTYNINQNGLFIRTLTPSPLQSKILVSFSPPFGRGIVQMICQVVWRKELDAIIGKAAPVGMGVQIIDAWTADKKGYEAGYNALLKQARDEQIQDEQVKDEQIQDEQVKDEQIKDEQIKDEQVK